MKPWITGGVVALSILFKSSAAEAEQIFMPDAAHDSILYLNINPSELKWDDVRERDILGKDHCFDRNNDGIADLGNRAGADFVLKGDQNKYDLYVFRDDYSQPDRVYDVSHEDAVLAMKRFPSASGLLINQTIYGPDLVRVYSVRDGEIKVSRPVSYRKIGEWHEGVKACEILKMP